MYEELTAEQIDIAKRGINRFFGEGYVKWPKIKLSELFYSRSLKSRDINAILEQWEKQGSIRLIRSDDVYIEILKYIE